MHSNCNVTEGGTEVLYIVLKRMWDKIKNKYCESKENELFIRGRNHLFPKKELDEIYIN